MKTNSSDSKKRHISARAKLVPAVAMLSTSAIMLSTSTYAWFTMNKEVEVTGFQMTATTSDSLEISLGSIGSDNSILKKENTSIAAKPNLQDDPSWTNKIALGDYYNFIGLLKPASSSNAINMYDAEDASNGGKSASKFKAVSGAAHLELNATKNTGEAITNSDKYGTSGNEQDATGYYIDIPVHLRTSETGASTATKYVYAVMNLTAGSKGNNDPSNVDRDLYKAVRVAFIDDSGNDCEITDETAAVSVFAADNQYYNKSTGKNGGPVTNTNTKEVDNSVVIDTNVAGGKYTGLNFNLSADSYSGKDFIIRIWLEGESEFCNNLTSGQNWNIDFKFGLSDSAQTPPDSLTAISAQTPPANNGDGQQGDNNGQNP